MSAYSCVSTAPPTMILHHGASLCSSLILSSILTTVVVINALSPTSGACLSTTVSTIFPAARLFRGL